MMRLPEVTADFLRANPLPAPARGGDKQERGRVLVIAGSVEVPGAALLAGLSALRAGAGILQIATCRSVAPHLGMAMPEAMVISCSETSSGEIDPSNATRLAGLASGCDAVLIGPGMMDDDAVGALISTLIEQTDGPAFVFDAAAFTCLQKTMEVLGKHAGRTVVTPHSGEMAKFLEVERSEIEADPLTAARGAANRLQSVVAYSHRRSEWRSVAVRSRPDCASDVRIGGYASGNTCRITGEGCVAGSGNTLGGLPARGGRTAASPAQWHIGNACS